MHISPIAAVASDVSKAAKSVTSVVKNGVAG
jgi:hypothetical protein